MNALQQASQRCREAVDPINVFRSYLINGIQVQQPFAPILYTLLPKLISTAEIKTMQSRWERRPDYASFDIYGTTNLYWLLMYVNGCSSSMEFTKSRYNTILAPNIKEVMEVPLFTHLNTALF